MSDGVLEGLAVLAGIVGAVVVLGYFLGLWK
jgi:hypothetical protein